MATVIEKTGKKWKLIQAIGVAVMIPGVVLIYLLNSYETSLAPGPSSSSLPPIQVRPPSTLPYPPDDPAYTPQSRGLIEPRSPEDAANYRGPYRPVTPYGQPLYHPDTSYGAPPVPAPIGQAPSSTPSGVSIATEQSRLDHEAMYPSLLQTPSVVIQQQEADRQAVERMTQAILVYDIEYQTSLDRRDSLLRDFTEQHAAADAETQKMLEQRTIQVLRELQDRKFGTPGSIDLKFLEEMAREAQARQAAEAALVPPSAPLASRPIPPSSSSSISSTVSLLGSVIARYVDSAASYVGLPPIGSVIQVYVTSP